MQISKDNRTWLDDFNLSHPLVIAGPCSAETEDQMLKTAHKLKDTDVSVFRAGIWKPRTRPGGFEGVGEIGLPWLQKVKEETGMKVITEVGNANHVALALKHNIDMLWIGARTTVNPFVVQEIADALKGVDIPVLVKNPVNPDLPLWLGAVERFKNAGISQLGVIHRGFSTYNNLNFRNRPTWRIVIELMRNFPDLPVIIDPSHICGRRDTIFEVSQAALDLRFHGLMVETHIDPDNAWSDAKQQITPEVLIKMMEDLKVRKNTSSKEDFQHRLNAYRKELDTVDHQMIELLADRMEVAKNIGLLKEEENVSVLQPSRWSEILEKMVEQASQKGLKKEFILEVFKSIHVESIDVQQRVRKEL
jgi:chorismate mutase